MLLSLAIKFVTVWSSILGKSETIRNYKGYSVIFPKILAKIERFTKSEKYSYSSLHHIFESEKCSYSSLHHIFEFLSLRKLR